MALRMLLDEAKQLTPHTWSLKIAPHEVQVLGQPKMTEGPRTVLLVENPSFDADSGTLQLDASGVVVLNLGTTKEAVAISSTAAGDASTAGVEVEGGVVADYGPGDREFLGHVNRLLEGNAREAAELILQEIRARYPGDLQKGKRRNFKNTPDNFWYVVVQPRVQSLSITVRGAPDRFQSSILQLKMDRPGYTRFTIDQPSQVQEALRIIQHSKRK